MVRITSSPSILQRRRSTGPVRNGSPRLLRLQLLGLVFSLMMVVILMQKAAQPKNWLWMWQLGATPGEAHTNIESPDDVDTRVPELPESPGQGEGGTIVATEQLVSRPPNERPTLPGFLPGIDPERFVVIRDDTIFRREESIVWYEMLDALADSNKDTLLSFPAEPVTFVQLYRQPAVYRGKMVSVEGTIRRAQYVQDPGGHSNVPGYWQCWLQPTGTSQVIVVYSLAMPTGFQGGDDLQEFAKFAGLFYKRWAYMAHDGLRSTPLVLSREGEWTPQPTTQPTELPQLWQILVVIIPLGLLSLIVAWWVAQDRSRTPQRIEESRGT